MPKKMTLEEFIEKGISIHKNKYDYSKSVYFNRDTSLIIICNKHGEFMQKPRVHIQDRCGCPKCDPTSVLGNEVFIEKSILRHRDVCKEEPMKLKREKNLVLTNKTINKITSEKESFIAGAKYQQEISYSEEDMRKAFCIGFCANIKSSINDAFYEWFEQFKK